MADNSLVIRNFGFLDSGIYFCNRSKIYLKVTTDPSEKNPKTGGVPVTSGKDGQDFGSDSSEKRVTVAKDEDAKNQQPSNFRKIHVGVAVGAVLVLLVIVLLTEFRSISLRRQKRDQPQPG